MVTKPAGLDSEKREAILAAAHEHFARYGYKKTSVDEIAKSAGVAKGTIYLAAPSKAELFYEVLLREIRAWNAEIARGIDPSEPADQLLVVAGNEAIRSLDARPLAKELLLGDIDEIVPQLKPRLRELRALGESLIADILRLGQRQGVFRAELDVEPVASILLDVQCSTYLFHWDDDGPDSPVLLRRAAAGFDLILRGLRTDPR